MVRIMATACKKTRILLNGSQRSANFRLTSPSRSFASVVSSSPSLPNSHFNSIGPPKARRRFIPSQSRFQISDMGFLAMGSFSKLSPPLAVISSEVVKIFPHFFDLAVVDSFKVLFRFRSEESVRLFCQEKNFLVDGVFMVVTGICFAFCGRAESDLERDIWWRSYCLNSRRLAALRITHETSLPVLPFRFVPKVASEFNGPSWPTPREAADCSFVRSCPKAPSLGGKRLSYQPKNNGLNARSPKPAGPMKDSVTSSPCLVISSRTGCVTEVVKAKPPDPLATSNPFEVLFALEPQGEAHISVALQSPMASKILDVVCTRQRLKGSAHRAWKRGSRKSVLACSGSYSSEEQPQMISAGVAPCNESALASLGDRALPISALLDVIPKLPCLLDI